MKPITRSGSAVGVRRLVRHLDLFSGIGGFALAAKMVGGIETVGFCEIDPWARKVLQKNFPNVPTHHDIKTLKGDEYGTIDLITGGFPCQPFSVAGPQRAQKDDRHLWPEMLRVVTNARPTWVLCENVAGLIKLGLDQVEADLEAEGYTVRTLVVPACAVGANHRRERVWILANTAGDGCNESSLCSCYGQANEWGEKGQEEDSDHERCCGVWPELDGRSDTTRAWGTEPPALRVDDGLPSRMDRNRGLGNAIVPQVAAEILRAMIEVDSLPND